ncbi:MAG: DNA polymerase III subunit beta [Parcubacteria group bacterium Gr01-1014_29]|nr:MAG: DNA polymerase III subunit beta [Parcubacteria group bacterium Gr01-1014_29]
MKFIVLKENLCEGVLLAEKSTGKKTTLPILSSILCSAQNGKILLVGTNLETAVEVWVGGKIEREGSIAIPARVLSSYISLVGGDQITLSSRGENLEVSSDKGKTIIRGCSTNDFPLVPRQEEISRFTLPAGSLRDALRRVVFAVSVSDIRPELASIFFSITPTTTIIAATDSFRLAEQKIQGTFGEKGWSQVFLLPAKSANDLARLLEREEENVLVSLGKGQIVFSTKRFRLTSRLTEGSFPDYKQIVPAVFCTEFNLPKDVIMDTLRVTGLFVSKLHDVIFHVQPSQKRVEVRSANADVGENIASLPATIQGSELQISFNYRYIMDGLGQVEGDVVFGFTSASGPLMIRTRDDTSYFYVVMPMKV